jgi:hypothetical protein
MRAVLMCPMQERMATMAQPSKLSMDMGGGRKPRPKSTPFSDFDVVKGDDPKVVQSEHIKRMLAERPVFTPWFIRLVVILHVRHFLLEDTQSHALVHLHFCISAPPSHKCTHRLL